MDDKFKQVDISYSYNFPVRDVFEAWINPAYLAQWFAPHDCTIEFKKLDIREGGSFHSCVHTPLFGDCWCIGVYQEILSNRKIVFTMINADKNGTPLNSKIETTPDWPVETIVTVTFSEVNGKTTVRLKQTVSESMAKKTGAYQGWIQMFERMQKLVEENRTHKPL